MPWIRLSHDNSTDSTVLVMQHGAVDFVTKPVDMNRLLGAIRMTLVLGMLLWFTKIDML